MPKKKSSSTGIGQERLEEKIIKWYESGISAPKIAKKEEVSFSSLTVLNILRKHGVEIRPRGNYATEITDQSLIDKMISDYRDKKMSFHDLGKKYKKNPNTIYYHLKKNDLTARRMKKLNHEALKDIWEQYEKNPSSTTIRTLAKKYEVSTNAIRYHVKKGAKD